MSTMKFFLASRNPRLFCRFRNMWTINNYSDLISRKMNLRILFLQNVEECIRVLMNSTLTPSPLTGDSLRFLLFHRDSDNIWQVCSFSLANVFLVLTKTQKLINNFYCFGKKGSLIWFVGSSWSDGETYISADDLRINLWNLEISDQCFNILDMKPPNMEDLTGR